MKLNNLILVYTKKSEKKANPNTRCKQEKMNQYRQKYNDRFNIYIIIYTIIIFSSIAVHIIRGARFPFGGALIWSVLIYWNKVASTDATKKMVNYVSP